MTHNNCIIYVKHKNEDKICFVSGRDFWIYDNRDSKFNKTEYENIGNNFLCENNISVRSIADYYINKKKLFFVHEFGSECDCTKNKTNIINIAKIIVKKYLLNSNIELLNVCYLCRGLVDDDFVEIEKIPDENLIKFNHNDIDIVVFKNDSENDMDYGINILGKYDRFESKKDTIYKLDPYDIIDNFMDIETIRGIIRLNNYNNICEKCNKINDYDNVIYSLGSDINSKYFSYKYQKLPIYTLTAAKNENETELILLLNNNFELYNIEQIPDHNIFLKDRIFPQLDKKILNRFINHIKFLLSNYENEDGDQDIKIKILGKLNKVQRKFLMTKIDGSSVKHS